MNQSDITDRDWRSPRVESTDCAAAFDCRLKKVFSVRAQRTCKNVEAASDFMKTMRIAVLCSFLVSQVLGISAESIYYEGLFLPAGTGAMVTVENSGSITLENNMADRTFTFQLRIGATQYGQAGTFDSNNQAQVTIVRSGLPDIVASWAMSPDLESITGTVASANWLSTLSADRAYEGESNQFVGRYTFLVLGLPGSGPPGDGFGTMTVDPFGAVRWSGTLADSETWTESRQISLRGRVAIHSYLNYLSSEGMLIGWVDFTACQSRDGLHWIKTAAANEHYYPEGFSLSRRLVFAPYAPPAAGSTSPITGWNVGTFEFEGGNLSDSVRVPVSIGTANRFTNLSSLSFAATIALSSGLISGTCRDPNTSKTVAFKAAILGSLCQPAGGGNPASIGGFFLGTNEAGAVRCGPFQIPPLLPDEPLAGPGTLVWPGVAGQRYEVVSTEALGSPFQSRTTVTATNNGTMRWTDPETNAPHRFYRIGIIPSTP